MPNAKSRARTFLGGAKLAFAEADALWKELKNEDELSLARLVLARLRRDDCLLDRMGATRSIKEELCRQEAMLTSKDVELNAATRHDRALTILAEEFDIDDNRVDGDAETLGIAGGICKRRWNDLGQIQDLMRAAKLYERGARGNLGSDGYAQINSAFLEDLLAEYGDDPLNRRQRARSLRQRIIQELPASGDWWNSATRAEALFGLGRYAEATKVLLQVRNRPAPWQLQTTTRQIAHIAHLREVRPLELPEIRKFFETLLPGAGDAVRSVIVGKVGLALSGGGFRASFYHLGVLARLAELNVLRHVEVLSCVSGVRRRMVKKEPLGRDDYVSLVRELIDHFQRAVATDLRGHTQPSKIGAVWRVLNGKKGVMDPEAAAGKFEEQFYRPLLPGNDSLYMHELPFEPADHDPALTGSTQFHPGKHNWLRAHKVPALILNATTVNTGHAWQFTPTWMGESPWAVHEAADSISRLEWSWYEPQEGWKIELGRAVAASACVPGIFEPLRIQDSYKEEIKVYLVDGGVHDNQGTVSLLALNCNVLLVSDACGQLLLEKSPPSGLTGLASYAKRSMDTLMERVRLANYADLAARLRSGLLRGLMFLHMKAGLDADVIRLEFSQETYDLHRTPLSPSGVRKDFQQALAELRTDLDEFTPDESRALMACGYQMATKAYQRDLATLPELSDAPIAETWVFNEMLGEITSMAASSSDRKRLLDAFREGSKVKL